MGISGGRSGTRFAQLDQKEETRPIILRSCGEKKRLSGERDPGVRKQGDHKWNGLKTWKK